MNDQELTILAARAAKIELLPAWPNGALIMSDNNHIMARTDNSQHPGSFPIVFDPLFFDSQAFRLQVLLNIKITKKFAGGIGIEYPITPTKSNNFCNVQVSFIPTIVHDFSSYRRAIVTGAAKMSEFIE